MAGVRRPSFTQRRPSGASSDSLSQPAVERRESGALGSARDVPAPLVDARGDGSQGDGGALGGGGGSGGVGGSATAAAVGDGSGVRDAQMGMEDRVGKGEGAGDASDAHVRAGKAAKDGPAGPGAEVVRGACMGCIGNKHADLSQPCSALGGHAGPPCCPPPSLAPSSPAVVIISLPPLPRTLVCASSNHSITTSPSPAAAPLLGSPFLL